MVQTYREVRTNVWLVSREVRQMESLARKNLVFIRSTLIPAANTQCERLTKNAIKVK